MIKVQKLNILAWSLLAACIVSPAHAATDKVVIGDIDDMSGLYSDVIGQGGIEAAKMAIEDFGGSRQFRPSQPSHTCPN